MNNIFENAIGGLLGGLVCAAILYAVKQWHTARTSRVVLRRIRHRDDDDFAELLDLYSQEFPPDGSNYSAADIAAFIPGRGEPARSAHVACDNIVLVAKKRDEILAFIWCCYYPDRHRAIVPYFAIDRGNVAATGGGKERPAKLLSDELIQILLNHPSPCRQLIFEVQKPSADLPEAECRQRLGRIELFLLAGRLSKRPVHVLDFPYRRPKLTPENDSAMREEELVLMYSSFGNDGPSRPPTKLSRDEVASMLEFLYLDCYGDILEKDHADFSRFRGYLKSRLKMAVAALPAEVPVKETYSRIVARKLVS